MISSLTSSAEDRERLHDFYHDIYTPEFPDPNERESLANIEHYLELADAGSYGVNAYHVLIVELGGRPCAGVIADYLAGPNAGVLEFLVVSSAERRSGLGRLLLDAIEATLAEDARRAGHDGLDVIVAEINDPFETDLAADNLDPFLRAQIWGHWGYRRLDFPYLQPALSDDQQPIDYLMLAFKPVAVPSTHTLRSAQLLEILRGYMIWAMRIPEPDANLQFQTMRAELAARPQVASIRLDCYVGHDPDHPLAVHEIESPTEQAFEAALAVYQAAFTPGATSVDAETLARAVRERSSLPPGVHYHLWALRAPAAAPIDGVVSFFTLPGVGFGGYMAMGETLRGRGLARLVGARVERQLRHDDPHAHGWLAECEPSSDALAIVTRLGFREIALDYRQPPLPHHDGHSPPLALVYKSFGARHTTPVLSREQLREALHHVFAVVYAIADPRQHPLFTALDEQMRAWPTEAVAWR